MPAPPLHRLLDDPPQAIAWLESWGLTDARRGHACLVNMATAGVPLDLLGSICERLAESLPTSSDPDMALNNFERFVTAARSPLALASLFERDPESLGILVQIFSTSQHFSDLLIRDPAGYDLLRMTEGQPVAREVIVSELAAEVAALNDEQAVTLALRRFKHRETLRIAYGDLIRSQRLSVVTAQISYLADAIVEAALRFARQRLEAKRGVPRGPSGAPARFVVLAMGKLGGVELNYSSDIDLVFLYEGDGPADGDGKQSNVTFFDRLARDVVKLLTEPTALGAAYRVDLRLRPEGERGPLVPSVEQAARYYDVLGRTWERQAYVKARPIAGNLELGREFLTQLEPWIYRRYLALADITGIKALKRRIETRSQRDGDEEKNVKTGRGGIRDVEFAIQFLQLLNGGDLAGLRTGNTLEAIVQLERAGCLTPQERTLLEENYGFLRKIEHRLQLMFDLQTHVIPAQPDEVRKLAIRMGFPDSPRGAAREAFEGVYRERTAFNRKMLDHLLHDAFGDDAETEPEVDLVLDPAPLPERIQEVLGRYPFRDVLRAYHNLMALSTERIRFLSTRRCRHFLASIAPRLLKALAATPDPDSALIDLEKVSDSLGGKGVLWELFSFNPPSMELYVELCAFSPYLSGILISNPGMIDELMDSLVLNKLPTRADLGATLAELCRGAEDLDPILHSFKNAQQLRVGVRDVLGKEDIQDTLAALSDLADACLDQISQIEYARLVEKLGEPRVAEGDRAGQPCGYGILALGKFGGRELDYRSDLDLVFLYEAEGQTAHPPRSRRTDVTTNQHFFGELGQRIIKVVGRLGPHGRLYDIDPRLRPTGKSGPLATSLPAFARYYESGGAQLWERQALCKARIAVGTPATRDAMLAVVADAAFGPAWQPQDAETIRAMRQRMEEGAGPWNLKRGPGGMVDVEFLVQLLQLKHGPTNPQVRVANTIDALAALRDARCLSAEQHEVLSTGYRLLRAVKSRMRLMDAANVNDMTQEPMELARLARAMDRASGADLAAEVRQAMQSLRATYNDIALR